MSLQNCTILIYYIDNQSFIYNILRTSYITIVGDPRNLVQKGFPQISQIIADFLFYLRSSARSAGNFCPTFCG